MLPLQFTIVEVIHNSFVFFIKHYVVLLLYLQFYILISGIRSSASFGNISMDDLLTILPMENVVVAINVTGKDIVTALEYSVRRYVFFFFVKLNWVCA